MRMLFSPEGVIAEVRLTTGCLVVNGRSAVNGISMAGRQGRRTGFP